MDARRQAVLDVLGVTRYVSRAAPAAPSPGSPTGPAVPSTGEAPEAMGWEALEQAVTGCARCGLCASRTQTVFGTGDRAASLMVVGEAPGAEEDRQGLPFVGRAGQLLNAMLRSVGFAREQVYIANVLKCRPPRNRDPEPAEAEQCLPYLRRQIELVAPRALLCVGRIAAQNLLGTDANLGNLRGQVLRLGGTPVVVTYHPAYLLRTPAHKRRAWDDLRLARSLVDIGDGA
ncbi:MAG: uracil-DNA glycosylase [Steroidobacteraceae bacterium]|nr:uracil-DNA glycosylase [Steroidobacteraceae bacterium]